MIKLRIFLVIQCLLTCVFSFSQEIVPLNNVDLNDARINNTAVYNGESLWGYMDGGADLYLEYGLKSFLVQELEYGKEKLKIEISELSSLEEAFGIYSVSVFHCLQKDTINRYDCLSKYQYQTAYGNFYISVTSESGSDDARSHYLEIARAVMRNNPRRNLVLPDLFNSPEFNPYHLFYFQGVLSIQNSNFPWQELVAGIRFTMFAIVLPHAGQDVYFARITFPETADREQFLSAAGLTQGVTWKEITKADQKIYREFRKLNENSILFMQSRERFTISQILGD